METAYFKRHQENGIYHYFKVFGGGVKNGDGYQEVLNFLGEQPMLSVEHNSPFSLTGTWCTYEVGIPISEAEYQQAYQSAIAADFVIR